MNHSLTHIKLLLLLSTMLLSESNLVVAQQVQPSRMKPSMRSIELPSVEKDTMASLPLDREIYSASSQQLSDLRIVDDREIEIPFIRRTLLSEIKKTVHRYEFINNPKVQLLDKNAISIEFEIDPATHKLPIKGFNLNTALLNFERTITLEHKKKDSDQWETVLKDFLIYDYSQFLDARNTSITLPEGQPPLIGGFFRIQIQQAIQEQELRWMTLRRTLKEDKEIGREETLEINRQPFRIERISFWQDDEIIDHSQPNLQDIPLSNITVQNDKETRSTWIEFQSGGEPLSELTLSARDNNFNRACKLISLADDSTENSSPGQTIANANLSKINISGIEHQQLTMKCGDSRHFRYRFIIDNGDNPPLEDLKLSAKGSVEQLIFLATPGRTYRLSYGVADRVIPNYDTLAIQTALTAKIQPIEASLGKVESFTPKAKEVPPTPWYENIWLAVGVITALIFILLITILNASKRLDSMPKPEDTFTS